MAAYVRTGDNRLRRLQRFRCYGLRGAGLSFHDIASRCFNVYCTRALCASMSKQLGQSVRHLLRVTVVHAASGSIAKLTPVGRPHLPQ